MFLSMSLIVAASGLAGSSRGRPAYHPSVLLKLHIYGYLIMGISPLIEAMSAA